MYIYIYIYIFPHISPYIPQGNGLPCPIMVMQGKRWNPPLPLFPHCDMRGAAIPHHFLSVGVQMTEPAARAIYGLARVTVNLPWQFGFSSTSVLWLRHLSMLYLLLLRFWSTKTGNITCFIDHE